MSPPDPGHAPCEEEIACAVLRVQDWVIPRLEHPNYAAAGECRDVVANAIRQACGLPEEPAAKFVRMVKSDA